MLKVVICCGAGMSSSYLAQKMQNGVNARGLQDEISFDFYCLDLERDLKKRVEVLNNYDVAMCCPHLKHVLDDFLKKYETTCAMYIFPPKMYGTLEFDEVITEAKDVYDGFQKEHKNPFVFPGEEGSPLKIKRGCAYRNKDK